jgi:hypothetical protein
MTRLVYVGWTPQAPTQALVLELRTRHPGQRPRRRHDDQLPSGRPGYTAPFATNAQTHHRPTAPLSGPTHSSGAIIYASLAALSRIRTRPA